MNPYEAMMGQPQMQPQPMMPQQGMMPQQPMMPMNPHMIDPYTFEQGPGDRFPRTRSLGAQQDIEMVQRQLDEAKIEADLQKDLASYESKMISLAKSDMQDYMQMLKGGVV